MSYAIRSLAILVSVLTVFSHASAQTEFAGTTSPLAIRPTADQATQPLDMRYTILPKQWRKVEKGVWVAPRIRTEVAFDELIYDWKVRLPRDMGFRLYLQVIGEDQIPSPWLYAGYWGSVKLVESREDPKWEFGALLQDQLKLTKKAHTFQFKLVDEGKVPLAVLPRLNVIATDNQCPARLAKRYIDRGRLCSTTSSVILDIPLNAQVDSGGNYLPDRCQSAALAAALQYYGTTVPLEHIIFYNTDPEYKAFGIWPRTINTAVELGFDAYIDRFRDWDKVRCTVAENKVILCSITMPAGSDYIAPPYPKMPGHIVALCGVTDDGRVVVTDSALAKDNRGYLCQWLLPDFERVWMHNKGGVGMVICPPKGAGMRKVANLPPFPHEQRQTRLSPSSGTLQREDRQTSR